MKALTYLLLFLLPVAPASAAFRCAESFRSLFVHRTDRLPTIEKQLAQLEEKARISQGTKRYEIYGQMNNLFNERAAIGRGYKTIPMRYLYVHEEMSRNPRRYLTPAERAEIEVTVENNLIHRKDGSILDTKQKPALFVMDADGRIYIIEASNNIRHSSLLAGGPVASAGEIIAEEGKIQAISNFSGHYHPSLEIFLQVLREIPVDPSKVQQKSLRGF